MKLFDVATFSQSTGIDMKVDLVAFGYTTLVDDINCLFFSEPLSSLLWNLHKYYSQFSDCVQTTISQLRQPIEKELKVFISVPLRHMLILRALSSSCDK